MSGTPMDLVDLMDGIDTNLRRARAIVNAHAAACISGALGDPSADDHGDIAGTVDEMLRRAQELAQEMYRRNTG